MRCIFVYHVEEHPGSVTQLCMVEDRLLLNDTKYKRSHVLAGHKTASAESTHSCVLHETGAHRQTTSNPSAVVPAFTF